MHPLRRLMRHFGIDVHRFNPYSSEEARLAHLLSQHGITLVLDVGANCGQYATMLRDAGYRNRIVSFEPTAEAHSQLVNACKRDDQWTPAERVALGSRRDQLVMNISGNNTSNSILPMLGAHAAAEPSSVYITSEIVSVVPLDDIAPQYVRDHDRTFLKLDVQGFEGAVLDGAPDLLEKAVGVQVEMSLIPLYEGQPGFPDLFERITDLKFVPWTILQGFCDMSSGRMFQCDCVFFRD